MNGHDGTLWRPTLVAVASGLASSPVASAGRPTAPTRLRPSNSWETCRAFCRSSPRDKQQHRLQAAPGTGEAGQGRGRATLPTPQDGVAVADNPAMARIAGTEARATARTTRPQSIATSPASSRRSRTICRSPWRPPRPSRHVAALSGQQASSRSARRARRNRTRSSRRSLAETQPGQRHQGAAILSEPPLVYRQPSDTAPVGEVGEDEVKKERRHEGCREEGRWRLQMVRSLAVLT